MKHWTIEIDADGIALVHFDMAGSSVNTLSDESIAELGGIVDQLRSDEAIKGLVIASGKPGNFCVGGDIPDLDKLAGPPDPAHAAEILEADFNRFSAGHAMFRGLETSGKPVA
ncbi:MAG: enoyl-CoA hydratase-related protein [Sphingomicrobium sp.]